MTIDEAIKCLTNMLAMEHGSGVVRRIDAIKLGIEALKRVKELRDAGLKTAGSALPGETAA